MKIEFHEGVFLTEIQEGDQNAYLEHLTEKKIYDNTSNIPYPYTEADANVWVKARVKENQSLAFPINYAIRREDGYLIGSAGFHSLEPGKSFKAEIGYWLAKPYWGHGIVTDAVNQLCEVGFNQFGLTRIYARVFTHNQASARVLEKCGFILEGVLRKNVLKDGCFLDTKIYGLVK